MEMHLGEFMTLMFSDIDTENANYNNIDITDEHLGINTDFRENLNTVNHLNLQVSDPDVYNITAQRNCITANDTDIGTVMSSAFAALTGDINIESNYTSENNSFTQNEMETFTSMPENEVTKDLNNDDTLHEVHIVNPVQSEALNDDCREILNALRDIDSNRKTFWEATSVENLCTILDDKIKIFKTLQKKEIMICLDTINKRRNENVTYFLSWNKTKLTDALSKVFHNVSGNTLANEDQRKKKRKYNPPKLAKLVSKFLNKMPKDTLAVTLCENIWPEYFDKWSELSIVKKSDALTGCEKQKWFSQPSVAESGNPRFHFNDACHILTCLRTKICTTGITGLSKAAWDEAAESKQTMLNIAIVKECIDKQSVAFAKRVFGEDVELFMKSMAYEKEARFVHLLRRWFEAEDEPGISVLERCYRRLELRDYLLDQVNFGSFPPKTQYIKGIPIITYESLLVHIERKLQIFQFLPEKCYNPRALGTQEVEQFFSTLRDLDPSGLGTPKPDDIPDMMATAAFLDNARMDPDRSFFMRTSRAPVYPDNSMLTTQNMEEVNDLPSNTLYRDHFFDTTDRKRKKQKRKTGNVSAPDQPAHGQRGVRQYHACDESKILAHIRKGLTDV